MPGEDQQESKAPTSALKGSGKAKSDDPPQRVGFSRTNTFHDIGNDKTSVKEEGELIKDLSTNRREVRSIGSRVAAVKEKDRTHVDQPGESSRYQDAYEADGGTEEEVMAKAVLEGVHFD